MLCPKCQTENPDDAKFCGSCGATMSPPPTRPVGGGGAPPSEEVSDGLKMGIIIGSIFIPLLGIIMGVVYMQDPNPKKKAVGKLWLQVGIGVVIASCVLFFLCSMLSGGNF